MGGGDDLKRLTHLLAGMLVVGTAALGGVVAATAQDYPTRPIHLVVPFPAGGSADTLARTIGQGLSERLKQSVIIENRLGAGGNLGTDGVAKSPPDGYTILVSPSSIAIAPALYAKLPFDPVRDFAPVSLVANIPMVVIVNPGTPIRTMAELVGLAKEKRGELSYASAGNGTTNHLAVELFKAETGIEMLHVPYRGNPQAILDVIGGRVPVMFDFVLTALPQVRDGKVRGVATTGKARSSVLPDLPTVAETVLPGFEAGTWFGFYAPAGTPREIVDKLHATIVAVLQQPDVSEKLTRLGVEIIAGTPEQLGETTKADVAKWGPIVQRARLKLE